ncbi:MAG: hypothetical protein ACI8TX_002192 [Hyphomicrobiaceae bacterium]|jgi:hypothetical protein
MPLRSTKLRLKEYDSCTNALAGLGVQQRVCDTWLLRAGYNYNSSPIPDELSFFSVSAPGARVSNAMYEDSVALQINYYLDGEE